MKMTEIKATPKAPEFKVGDFFLTSEGYLRQIIRVEAGKFGIFRPEDGLMAVSVTKPSPEEIAQHYVNHNGTITKANVSEMIFAKTNEILEEEE